MTEKDSGLTEEQLARVAARAVRLYAETHPRPTQVSTRQAAEILGVAPRTVRRYILAGKMRLNGAGYLAIEDVDAIRSSHELRTARR
jgi:hypothetical protein